MERCLFIKLGSLWSRKMLFLKKFLLHEKERDKELAYSLLFKLVEKPTTNWMNCAAPDK